MSSSNICKNVGTPRPTSVPTPLKPSTNETLLAQQHTQMQELKMKLMTKKKEAEEKAKKLASLSSIVRPEAVNQTQDIAALKQALKQKLIDAKLKAQAFKEANAVSK